LQFLKQRNFFIVFFGCSFDFASQIWFVELEKVLLYHFKSLTMEENWKRFVKVSDDKLVFNDEQFSYFLFYFLTKVIKSVVVN
jgi:hypothetical protein